MSKFRWKASLIAASILFLVLGGCSQNVEVSAEEIIHNVVETEVEEIDEFYGKSEMTVYEGEDIIEESVMEEYASGNNRKIIMRGDIEAGEEEIETLNNGEKMVMYNKSDGTAQEMDTSVFEGIQISPKEIFQNMLAGMEDSHDYEVIGDEQLLDRDTFHMKLEAKEANSLMGDMEIWVDKETWIILKTISETGDSKMESVYTELDFSPDFTEDTFTLDIPEEIEITDMEDNFSSEFISVEEAEEELGQAFYMFSEEDYHLGEIELYGSDGELQRKELNLTYISDDEIPMFNLSIFESPADMEIEESDVEIRGNVAAYEESINNYYWDEDGLRYSLLINDPDMEEEVLELTEEMILSSEQ
ncbi:hypothetical protein J18TS1_41640 [Oceanobacillus oncorhynchi subsp. incaldanensis]|uniref:Sporulation protein YdcC n=1 Tax=Oceanobacillus oncorhynchi TaxID=545501 RepID=A0A0A1MV32_9BACI|nr:hypothetical protein [Oceanobacillus oncorhynchi]GIO21064.1 hypothetical protein J18TS1_41640 [Oceanobacillus oncorhynchi subsp. incaldanensis]CEI83302.1 hypothetical protein BN997_03208 [Oceanobacillus oncorhynchi]